MYEIGHYHPTQVENSQINISNIEETVIMYYTCEELIIFVSHLFIIPSQFR